MSNQTCGQVSGSSAGSSVPVVGSSSPVVGSPLPKSNPMFDIGKSTPNPLFVAGASDPPTPNPFNTEVRDPKFIPSPGLRAAGRSQRRVWDGYVYCDSVPIVLGRSFGAVWSSEACTKAADVRAKL